MSPHSQYLFLLACCPSILVSRPCVRSDPDIPCATRGHRMCASGWLPRTASRAPTARGMAPSVLQLRGSCEIRDPRLCGLRFGVKYLSRSRTTPACRKGIDDSEEVTCIYKLHYTTYHLTPSALQERRGARRARPDPEPDLCAAALPRPYVAGSADSPRVHTARRRAMAWQRTARHGDGTCRAQPKLLRARPPVLPNWPIAR